MLVRILAIMALAASLATAQRGGGGGGMGGGMGDDSGMGGMGPGVLMRRPQSPQEKLLDKLKLNKDQREEATKILAAANEQAAPTRELLNKGRTVIANHITGKGSEDDLKKIMAEYTAIDATMVGIEADAFAKICALLKPNQRAKAAPAFELMAGMFSGIRPASGTGMGQGMGQGMGRGSGRGMGGR